MNKYIVIILVIIILGLLYYIYTNRRSNYDNIDNPEKMEGLLNLNEKLDNLSKQTSKLKESITFMNKVGGAGADEFQSQHKDIARYKTGYDYDSGDFNVINHKIPAYNLLASSKRQNCADGYRDNEKFKYTDKKMYNFGIPKYPTNCSNCRGGANPPLDIFVPTKISGLPNYYDRVEKVEKMSAPKSGFYGKYSRRFKDGDYSHYSNYYLSYNPNYKNVRASGVNDLGYDPYNAKNCSYQTVRFSHPTGNDSYSTYDNMTSRITTDAYYGKMDQKSTNMHDRYNVPEVFLWKGRNVTKSYQDEFMAETNKLRRLQMSLVRKRQPYPFKIEYK